MKFLNWALALIFGFAPALFADREESQKAALESLDRLSQRLLEIHQKTSQVFDLPLVDLVDRVKVMKSYVLETPPVVSIVGLPRTYKTSFLQKILETDGELSLNLAELQNSDNSVQANFILPGAKDFFPGFMEMSQYWFGTLQAFDLQKDKAARRRGKKIANIIENNNSRHEVILADHPAWDSLAFEKNHYAHQLSLMSDLFIVVVPSSYPSQTFLKYFKELAQSKRPIALVFLEENGFQHALDVREATRFLETQGKMHPYAVEHTNLNYGLGYRSSALQSISEKIKRKVLQRRAVEVQEAEKVLQKVKGRLESLLIPHVASQKEEAVELDAPHPQNNVLTPLEADLNALNLPRTKQIPREPLVDEIFRIWIKYHSKNRLLKTVRSYKEPLLYMIKRRARGRAATLKESQNAAESSRFKEAMRRSDSVVDREIEVFRSSFMTVVNYLYQIAQDDPTINPEYRQILLQVLHPNRTLQMLTKLEAIIRDRGYGSRPISISLRSKIKRAFNQYKKDNPKEYARMQMGDMALEVSKIVFATSFTGLVYWYSQGMIVKVLMASAGAGPFITYAVGSAFVGGLFGLYRFTDKTVDKYGIKLTLSRMVGDIVKDYQVERWQWFLDWMHKNYLKPIQQYQDKKFDKNINLYDLDLPVADCRSLILGRPK